EIKHGLYDACYQDWPNVVEFLLAHVDKIPKKCLQDCFAVNPKYDKECIEIVKLLLNHGNFEETFNVEDIEFLLYSDVSQNVREQAHDLITNYLYGLDSRFYNENVIP